MVEVESEPQSNIRRAERDILEQAKQAVGNPMYDHEYATQNLLEVVQRGLARRADQLAAEYKRLRLKLSIHAKKTIATKDAAISPRVQDFTALRAKADNLIADLKSGLLIRGDPKTESAERNEVTKRAKHKLSELSDIEAEMQAALEPIDCAIKDMETEIALAAPMWASIQGAERISMRLRISLLAARVNSTLLRVVIIGIALAVAVLIDRQTNIAETIMPFVTQISKHDLAVGLLFLLQTALFEPISSRLKKSAASTVYSQLTRRAEELLFQIEEYERQLERAGAVMQALEARVP